MKILISDYPDSMMPTHNLEKKILKEGLGDCEIVIYEYSDDKRNEFLDIIEDVDAILTGFIKIDKEVMDRAKNLKIVSMNATGYDNVDLETANEKGIGVCPVGEYCTRDVAEFTIGIIHALVKNLKALIHDIEVNHKWRYDYAPSNVRIEEMTLGICGLGKIGTAVAKKAMSLGMKVIAIDPFIDQTKGTSIGVEMLNDREELFKRADVVTNHMNLNESNYNYFDISAFEKMEKNPYFINMGRGVCVVEEDLITALEAGYIKGAGVDVLRDETPDLGSNALVGKENVIVTPHAAFYTTTSVEDLQKISTKNIVHYLNGEKEKVFKLVSKN